ncbi:MAG: tRNA uridine-5-carboxymethylaminomethyl(34) synthesis GTPase MnmE [Alphaproteobacteria bacterium]
MPPDTIFALASGRGVAGIALFRISGPATGGALESLGVAVPRPRVATRARLLGPVAGRGDRPVLDDALVLWFPAPASFTGEDVAELHVHGGRAVIDAVAQALGALPGLRPAEPGEFTRRAFEHGKLDLAQAEGLADLVAAETEAQRLQALAQLDGVLSRRFEAWRASLIALLAQVEAALDFSDEDVPEGVIRALIPDLVKLFGQLSLHIDELKTGEKIRDGFHVAIIGAPNVGKSSLLNALARRDVAIVSETKGTTRDIIEVHVDLGGIPVILADTAGLGDAGDEIEAEGVRRAETRAASADLRLTVFDASGWPEGDAVTSRFTGEGSITVLNKIDLLDPEMRDRLDLVLQSQKTTTYCVISALTGEGLDRLLAMVQDALSRRLEAIGPAPLTHERHRRALADAVEALQRAVEAPDPTVAPELLAEDLRLAGRALGRIAGHVDVEDVLDRIFSQFCIGK